MHPVILIGQTPVNIQDSISIVLRNPIFNEDGTPGSFIFDFSVPLTVEIKKEINFSNNPQALSKVYKKEVSIIAGAFNITGQGTLTAINDKQVSISLPIFTSSLRNVFEDKTLQQLDLGTMSPLVSYKTHAKAGLYGWGNAWHPSNPTDLIDSPVFFHNIISDPHDTFQPPQNRSRYTAPTSGYFNIILVFRYKVQWGRRLRFTMIRNETGIFHRTFNDPPFDQELTNVFSYTTYLEQGDQVRFRVRMDGMLKTASGVEQYHAKIDLDPNTELFVYSSLNVEDVLDRGYPYNNYTLLPVFNNAFFKNAPDESFSIDHENLSLINRLFPYVNYYNDGFPLLLTGFDDDDAYSGFNIISPQLFLPFVIGTIFEKENITIQNNLFAGDHHINQICIYANACLNNVASSSFSAIELDYQLSKALPDIPVIDFLTQVCRTLGIVFDYDNNTKTVRFRFINDIINDPLAVEFSDNILGSPQIAINRYSDFVVKYPDMSDDYVSENFKDLADVNYKGEVDSILNISWTDQNINDCYFCKENGIYFIYGSPVEGWGVFPLFRFFSQRFDFKRGARPMPVRGNETFEYTLGATPIMMRDYPKKDESLPPSIYTPERDWLTPASLRAGKVVGIPNDEQSYHLMFYRGMQKDGNGNDYPLGSNAYHNLGGEIDFSNSLTQPLDLSLSTSENSLYSKKLRDYLRWRVRTHGEYTFHKIMTSTELANLDFFKWYRILGMDYLIKEVKFEISSKGISPAEIIALPRYYDQQKIIPKE